MLTASDHDGWASRRIRLCYLWRHGRLPDLSRPRCFTELVQCRKLTDRDPRMTDRLDKLNAKRIAAELLGPEWVIPTLWCGGVLPRDNPFTEPVIVKARHGCNQNVVLQGTAGARDWERIRRNSENWLRQPYGLWLDEWAYRGVPRGTLVEPLLGGGLPLPIDYKIYVFGGSATHVQVHLGRGTSHRWLLHDRQGRKLAQQEADDPQLPKSLPAMFAAAETLAAGFSFARIDFYEVAGQPLFGEFCFYPGSGLDPFAEDWIDADLGMRWLNALGATSPAPFAVSGQLQPLTP